MFGTQHNSTDTKKMNSLLSKLSATLTLSCLMIMWGPTADADQLSFVAEGTVNFFSTELNTVFEVGDPFRIEYTFESTTPDSNVTDPLRGFYDNVISDVSIEVGPYSTSPTFTSSRITVYNNVSFPSYDRYRIDIFGASGSSAAGYPLNSDVLLMQLSDPTATAFTSDALPIVPLDPLNFVSGGTVLTIYFDRLDPLDSRSLILTASVDSIAFVAVSASESSSGGGGCFIASATYGTPMAGDINALRAVRDAYLLDTAIGSAFVDTYYRMSPPIADAVSRSPMLQSLVRVILTPIVVVSKGVLATPGLALVSLGLLLTVFMTLYAFPRRSVGTNETSNSTLER